MFSGQSVKARSIRGMAMTLVSFGGGKVLQLASNLILTRLLMPEVFGLMALVQVFVTGLALFSDIGLRSSIIQNKRGDEPDFLNTVWTMQIMRGVLLWLLCCLIAGPAGQLYDEPMITTILPFAGLGPLIHGLSTTNVVTANRKLTLGKATLIELGSQAGGIAIMVGLAFMLQSVWALVIGNIVSTMIRVIAQHLFLPGIRNRLHWDQQVFLEVFQFGKFLFLSTGLTFVTMAGDRAILGAYVSLAELGVYNIGYLIGGMPLLLISTLSDKVVFPLYCLKLPAESEENRRNILKARRILIAGMLSVSVLLTFLGVLLIDVLYTDQYALAGPVVVLLGLAGISGIIQSNYGGLLLAVGDSKNFFILIFITGVLQTVLMFVGVSWYGIFGVILAIGLASVLTYPLRAYIVARYHGLDLKGDLAFALFGGSAAGLACWLNWDEIVKLM